MKSLYLIGIIVIVIVVFGAIILYKTNKNSKKETIPELSSRDTSHIKEYPAKESNYKYLRDRALSMKPEELGLQLSADKKEVYGVVMDWEVGNGIGTLVSFQSGDASIYFSNGGGVIGGIGHENIKQASYSFVDKAREYLNQATKVDSAFLPDNSSINFYLLTNQGKFLIKEKMKNFENNSSPYVNLFVAANKLMGELRLTSQRPK